MLWNSFSLFWILYTALFALILVDWIPISNLNRFLGACLLIYSITSSSNKSPVISNWKELFSLWLAIMKSIKEIKFFLLALNVLSKNLNTLPPLLIKARTCLLISSILIIFIVLIL